MDTTLPFYPSEELQDQLRALGVKYDLNTALLDELLPPGTITCRADSFWYCMNGYGCRQAEKQADAKALLVILGVKQEWIKI